MKLSVTGLAEVLAEQSRLERMMRSLGQYRASVGSFVPYAYGIERGVHQKSGKRARKAGGVYYLERAVNDVMAGADADIEAGLQRVKAPGPWVLRRLAKWARRLARANVPRRSGRLRSSIKFKVRRS